MKIYLQAVQFAAHHSVVTQICVQQSHESLTPCYQLVKAENVTRQNSSFVACKDKEKSILSKDGHAEELKALRKDYNQLPLCKKDKYVSIRTDRDCKPVWLCDGISVRNCSKKNLTHGHCMCLEMHCVLWLWQAVIYSFPLPYCKRLVHLHSWLSR